MLQDATSSRSTPSSPAIDREKCTVPSIRRLEGSQYRSIQLVTQRERSGKQNDADQGKGGHIPLRDSVST